MIEGFDSKVSFDGNVYYDPNRGGYGGLTYSTFNQGFGINDNGDSVFTQLKQSPLFLDSLTQLGYDIIIVDYKDNLKGLEQNAAALIKIIRWVNQEKETDEELVVIGGSMGGLVARYALRKMEMEDCCHQTRLYGTLDTPHKGANIPLGVQHWVYNAAFNFKSEEAKIQYNHMLKSRSASQMLHYHRESANQALFTEFQSKLDSMGWPQDCYRIAISNGNAQGLGLDYGPGDLLLKYEFSISLVKTIISPLPFVIIRDKDPFMMLKNNAYAVANSPNAISNQILLASKSLNAAQAHAAFIVGANLAATTSLYVASVKAAIAIAAFPPAAPVTLAAYLIPSAAICLPTSVLMATWHNYNANQSINYSANTPTKPIDYAPGSTISTLADLAGAQHLLINNRFISLYLPLGAVQAVNTVNTFVPTVSSLALPDTTDLFWSFFPSQLIQDKITPFHAIHIPEHDPMRHEQHVEITEANRQFSISQIEANRPILYDAGTTLSKTLPNTFNWGHPARVILHNVTVQNGGKMYVNKNTSIDYGINTSPPSPIHGTFELTTSYCGSLIEIENGGLFELGENNYQTYPTGIFNNNAVVNFRKNSTLEIHAGGTLRINDNSTLVLEPGAELIIHPGAVIDLAGPNAVLELQGKVTLLQNAVFSPIGSGFVRFAQAMQGSTDAPNYWSTNGQAQVRIVGSNGQKRAEVVENLYLTEVLDSVVFSQANTQIAAGKELHLVNVPVRLANSSFSAKDTTALHNGVHLYGQKAIVQNTRFSHGTVGLQANLNFNTKYIYLNGCTFTYNQTGVYIFNGGFIAEACTARYNQTGLQVFAATGNGLIQGGVYAHNTNVGIDASSAQNGQLTLLEAAVNNNTQGIHVNNMNLRSECSNISYNTQVGIAAENCFVQLQAGAQNHLLGNTYAIGLFNVYGIFLEDGLNDFSGSTSYINGNLTPINANPDINVNDNKMPGSPSALPIFVWFNNNGTWVYLPVVNWNSTVNLPTSCAPLPGFVGNTVAADAMRLFVSGKVINTTNYSNIWLHDALANAALLVSTSDHVYNDLLAIARFDEIFASISGSLTEMEMLAIEFATQLMVTALNNVYDQGLIPRNGAVDENPEHPYLHMVTANIHERLSATGINAEQLFNYNLLLAQTYRMAEHYDYALQILDSLNSSASNTQLLSSEYWACICDAEDRLLKQEIAPEDFVYEQDNCRQMLLALQKMQQELVHGYTAVSTSLANKKLIDIIFPNPVIDQLIISLVNQDLPAQITILDIAGKILMQQKVEPGSSPIILQTKHLAQGAYFLQVKQGSKEDVKRFVKMN